MEAYTRQAIEGAQEDESLIRRLRSAEGAPWRAATEALAAKLPEHIEGRQDLAYNLVARFADVVFGAGNWESYKRDKKSGPGKTTYLRSRGN